MSASASANPVAISPSGNFAFYFLLLVILNLPLNTFLYFTLLGIYYSVKPDLKYRVNAPGMFLEAGIHTVIYATLAGALIDALVFAVLPSFNYETFVGLMFLGGILVGLSFIILGIYIHRLDNYQSIIIGSAIGILNVIAWLTLVKALLMGNLVLMIAGPFLMASSLMIFIMTYTSTRNACLEKIPRKKRYEVLKGFDAKRIDRKSLVRLRLYTLYLILLLTLFTCGALYKMAHSFS